MEAVIALAIGVVTSAGVWLVLRPRTFQVLIGLSLLLSVGQEPRIAERRGMRIGLKGVLLKLPLSQPLALIKTQDCKDKR